MPGDSEDPLWLSAPKAVDACRIAFGLDEGGARRRLVRLAADEFVRTWCVRFVKRVFDEWSTDPGGAYDDDEILPQFWDDFARHGEEADWTNGSFMAATSFKEVRVYGVRFSGRDLANHKRKLDGLPALVRAQPTKRAPVSRRSRELAPVTDAQVRQWYESLTSECQAMGIRELWAAAKHDFLPYNYVERKQVEPFVRGRKRGRKAKE